MKNGIKKCQVDLFPSLWFSDLLSYKRFKVNKIIENLYNLMQETSQYYFKNRVNRAKMA